MVATLYVHAILFFFQTGNVGGPVGTRSMWSNERLPRTVVVIFSFFDLFFGVMIDRALMFSAARKQSRVFVQQARRLKDGKLDEAIGSPSATRRAHRQGCCHGLSEFESGFGRFLCVV